MAEEPKGITIVIPVGPQPEYKKYLTEALDSVIMQMEEEDQLFVVDDMAYLHNDEACVTRLLSIAYSNVLYSNDWLIGCAHSWNVGVARGGNEWCLLMGSDDKLLPGCLDACREVITDPKHDRLGYYNLTCETSEGDVIDLHNNAALVSKTLWRATGGFPPTASVGAPDALLISIMMVHFKNHLHQIKRGTPLYWVRVHDAQDTKRRAARYHTETISIRDKETKYFKPPKWTGKV